MIITRAARDEFEEIRRFYHSVIDAFQNAEYRPMWKKDIYPAPEQIRENLEENSFYIGRENGLSPMRVRK